MSSRKKGSQREEFKQEDILQAVVIADSFNVKFAPITENKPRALLPLVNVPLIDYTLEILTASGIERVIVFCCVHAELIRKHISSSKWSKESSRVDVLVVSFESCMSMGDALRELDARSLISGDFVLINADVVANVQLAPIIARHKERRQRGKNLVMTMIFSRLPPGHQSRCHEDEAVICLERSTSRLLGYDNISQKSQLSVPLAMLRDHRDVQLRYDLLDSQISVCSTHLLELFTDNFDYQTQDDFVRGILVSEEISGSVINVEILHDEYAARVSNPQMYDSVSKDVMARWTYPIVPDSDISNTTDGRYRLGRHNVYLQADVTLARGCVLGERVVIGQGSSIGVDSQITRSVIGRNCHIGENVRITDSYLWDDVVVGNGCSIDTCILDVCVSLADKVTLNPRCILASQVSLAAGVTLPSQTRLMSSPGVDDDEFDEDFTDSKASAVTSLYGPQAFLYQPMATSEDEEDTDASCGLADDFWSLRVDVVTHEDEESSDESEGESEEEVDGGGEDVRSSPPPDDANIFYDEVIRTLERALDENIDVTNLILETNSLKYAYNIQIRDVNHLVSKAIFQPQLITDAAEGKAFLAKFKMNIRHFLPLLRNYIRNDDSQVDCITALEEVALAEKSIAAVIKETLYFLYEAQVLEEDAIIKWYHSEPPDGSTGGEQLRKSVTALIEWLEDAEEETDDSD